MDDESSSGNQSGCLAILYQKHAIRIRAVLGATLRSKGTAMSRAGNLEVESATDEVDDLLHDVFARLLERSSTPLHEERDPVPYLVAMARNLHRDRQRRRRCSGEQLGASMLAEERERETQDVLQLELIAEYSAKLSPELLALYDARFARGLSQRDAATVLGVSRRRVRTLEERLLRGAIEQVQRAGDDVATTRPRRMRAAPTSKK